MTENKVISETFVKAISEQIVYVEQMPGKSSKKVFYLGRTKKIATNLTCCVADISPKSSDRDNTYPTSVS